MSITLQVTSSVRDKSGESAPITGAKEYTGSSCLTADKVIPASTTDSAIAIAFAHAAVVYGTILATGNCTLETNVAGSPVDTVAVLANVPTNWTAAAGDPFAADVTAWYVTTPSGASVHFQAMILLT